ncbi:MAG TPA: hypothetical protein VMF50_00160 [Candidatus Binataceae bacterium]|nr:hypothetical protein [Candidatus Binataceae bacterium]
MGRLGWMGGYKTNNPARILRQNCSIACKDDTSRPVAEPSELSVRELDPSGGIK